MQMKDLSCVAVPSSYHVEFIRNPCIPSFVSSNWPVDTQCRGQIGTDFEVACSIDEILRKLLVCIASCFNRVFLRVVAISMLPWSCYSKVIA